jgi:hypothetical protein
MTVWYIPENVKASLRPHLRRWKWGRSLRRRYKVLFKKDLNLKALNTFSEKSFGRMIMVNRNGNATFTRLADKYLVRDYVREKVGEHHLVKLLWQGTNPLAIPFDSLPRRYVIKANHGSGYNIFVDGEADRKKITETFQVWLKQTY